MPIVLHHGFPGSALPRISDFLAAFGASHALHLWTLASGGRVTAFRALPLDSRTGRANVLLESVARPDPARESQIKGLKYEHRLGFLYLPNVEEAERQLRMLPRLSSSAG